MRLAELLAEASTDDLERLAAEHARADHGLSRAQLLSTIEGVLRSHRFLQEFLVNRQPPTFALLTLLLDAPDYTLPNAGFRELVMAESWRLSSAIDAGDILARDDHLRVYRRVLYQARSNDMLIDVAESSILGVLRQELAVSQVEHFLIEHHAELREFWAQDEAFVRELHELRSAGIVYVREGATLLPEDLASAVRQVLGIDMSRPAARRLFGYLSNAELHDALVAVGAPSSGSKDERIERLVAHMAQPKVILRLRSTPLERLREICKDVGARSSGSKDDLVDRLVAHVASNRDVLREPEPPPLVEEPRRLESERFSALFIRLRGHELSTILGQFELRRSGSKEAQVRYLLDAHRSEETLLNALSSSDLEAILRRLELKASGSKTERVERLISHFASVDLEVDSMPPPPQSERSLEEEPSGSEQLPDLE